MWSLIGAILALASAAAAWLRSRRRGGFYDLETYGMSVQTHRRYAAVFAAFALYFAGLALYALVAVFYATSFLQGAPDRDE
jgi:hypothetical protein